jgi:hypothetical protein
MILLSVVNYSGQWIRLFRHNDICGGNFLSCEFVVPGLHKRTFLVEGTYKKGTYKEALICSTPGGTAQYHVSYIHMSYIHTTY